MPSRPQVPPRSVPDDIIGGHSADSLRASYSVTDAEATEFVDMGSILNKSPYTVGGWVITMYLLCNPPRVPRVVALNE